MEDGGHGFMLFPSIYTPGAATTTHVIEFALEKGRKLACPSGLVSITADRRGEYKRL